MPCSCCPTGDTRCALSQILFDNGPAVLVANPGGYGVLPLNLWSDGSIAGIPFTGFNTPGIQITPATSPTIDLVFAVPQDRIRGLREWNQGGGDLNDSDGFSGWDVDFRDPASVSLATGHMVMANGGAPFTFLLPGGQIINNVKSVRLTNMTKVNPGSGAAPLVREVEALQLNRVFSCRTPAGALQWYDQNGTLVPAADIVACP